MTTTTSRSRLPLVFLTVAAMIASVLAIAQTPAHASHSIEMAISDAYTGTKPFHEDCPCSEETGTNPTFKFDVTLTEAFTDTPTSPDPGDEITVKYATSERSGDGAADEGADYVGESGTLTFAAGESQKTIEIEVIGDDVDEPGIEGVEFFDVFLFGVEGEVRVIDDQGEGAIADDDPVLEPAIVIDDVQQSEGNSGTTEFDFTVRFVNASGSETLGYRTEDGTAEASDGDYMPETGTVTVSETTPEATISITVNGDEDVEPDETFEVIISGDLNAPIADDTGVGTILSEERPLAELSIGDVAKSEGDSGTTDFSFALTLDAPAESDVSVDYETRDGTAKVDDDDYEPQSGTKTIPEGQTSTTIVIQVIGDTAKEQDETFLVRLDDIEGDARLVDSTGEGNIQTDDPSLSVSDAFAEEPDEGTNGASFTVSLSEPADWEVTVDYATEDGSATAGEDYESRSDTLTFEAGETEKQVVIEVNADDEDEGSENFFLVLSNAQDAGIDDGRGEGQIGGAVVADAGPNKSGESAAPISFTGSASDGSGDYTFTWDFGDGTATQTGRTVEHHFPATGTFTVTLTVEDNANGDTSTDTATATITDSGQIERSFGSNREGTAIDVSSDHWNQAGTALLATGYAHADALAAGPLAKKLDAPLLLTNPNGLPDEVKQELDRLNADTVIILGGVHAVPQEQADELARSGFQVERIADVNRFGTAADIATRVGATSTNEVTVALGQHADENRDDWPDALSAGSFASLSEPLPSLLTHSSTVPQETMDALAELDTERIFLLGGSVAISDTVEQQLEAEGYTVQRVFGADRYGTSVAAAEIVMDRYPAGQVHPTFATGQKFPDGLTSGALAGKVGGPVLLVPSADLNNATVVRDFLREHANPFDVGTIVGGEAVVSNTVQSQARSDIDTS